MTRKYVAAVLVCAASGMVAGAQTQGQTQTPLDSATEDFAEPAAFPLAASEGTDSDAVNEAPPGAVNQGPFDPATWQFGTAFTPPPDAKIWNPVKLKMLQGGVGIPRHMWVVVAVFADGLVLETTLPYPTPPTRLHSHLYHLHCYHPLVFTY